MTKAEKKELIQYVDRVHSLASRQTNKLTIKELKLKALDKDDSFWESYIDLLVAGGCVLTVIVKLQEWLYVLEEVKALKKASIASSIEEITLARLSHLKRDIECNIVLAANIFLGELIEKSSTDKKAINFLRNIVQNEGEN